MYELILLAETGDGADSGIPWPTVLTAILSVPVTVLGVIGSVWLAKKTRLESRKLELEIREKEIALGDIPNTSSEKRFARLVAEPLFEGRRVQEIILRSILLLLILQAWQIGTLVLTNLVPRGVYYTFTPQPSEWLLIPLYLLVLAVKLAPTVGYYVVLIGMGFSIVLDILAHLNIRVPDVIDKFRRRSKVWYMLLTLVVLVIAASSYGDPFYIPHRSY